VIKAISSFPLIISIFKPNLTENEMGGACGTYGEGERYAQRVGGEARGKEAIGETQT
jgi:hypothetical protein